MLRVDLSKDSQNLDEVVVTAFRVGQKKESVVGAATQVKGYPSTDIECNTVKASTSLRKAQASPIRIHGICTGRRTAKRDVT